MATTDFDMRGLTIGLEHSEVDDLTNFGSTATKDKLVTTFGTLGLVGAWVPYVAAALALHIAWEVAAIRASDKGNGVWLNAPYPILIGMPGVLLPSTRTMVALFDGTKDSGQMTSEHSDVIKWNIDRNVEAAGLLHLTLKDECSWDKAIKVKVADKSTWVQANGNASANDDANAQDLTVVSAVFQKPQFLGAWGPAGLAISDWTGVTGGDHVTFTWVSDS